MKKNLDLVENLVNQERDAAQKGDGNGILTKKCIWNIVLYRNAATKGHD